MTFLRRSGSLVAVWIKSLATATQYSFCSGRRSHRTKFAMAHFMPRSCIKISDTVVFGISRSVSGSHIVAHLCWLQPVHVQHSQVFCLWQAFPNVDHFPQILDHLWSVCATFICAALTASSPKAFWIIQIVSTEECSSSMQKLIRFVALLAHIFLLSHFECNGHTVHMLTQQVYRPHWLVQWSHHHSHMLIPVHSPWLPGYINVVQPHCSG